MVLKAFFRGGLLVGSSLAALSVSPAAIAQSGNPQPAADAQAAPNVLGDIVVTARKTGKAEAVQKVPLSITALNPAQINQIHAQDLSDLSKLAPNVQLNAASTFPGFANFTIRGIGVNNSTASSDPAVSVVVDGVNIDYPTGMLLDTYDVSDVAILRGPQGILQGKNSTGGAVAINSARPTTTFQGSVSAQVGTYGEAQGALTLSGPLTEDGTLRARLAVMYRRVDGYFQNDGGGTFVAAPANPTGQPVASSHQDEVGQSHLNIRPSLTWAPSPNFDATVVTEFARYRDGGAASLASTDGPRGSVLLSTYGYTPPSGKFDINQDLGGYSNLNIQRYSLEMNLRTLGGTFTSITGFRHVDYATSWDADGTPFVVIEFVDNTQRQKQFSQELRYASNFSDVFRFVAGGFYDRNSFDVVENRVYGGALLGRAPALLGYAQGLYHQSGESAAAFGNFEWTIVPRLALSAGGRYTWEHKSADVVPIIPACAGPFYGCPSASVSVAKSWHDFSPRAGIQFQANPNLLLYGSYTKGFRSGAFNQRATNLTPQQVGPVDPETAASFEIGEKGTFLDGKLRVNIAAFRTKYSNIQRNILVGLTQYLANAADATITGVEMETSILPLPRVRLDGSLGYTHAKYNSFAGGNISWNGLIPNTDLKLDHVPEFTYNIAGQYTLPLSDKSNASFRISYAHRSSYFVDAGNTPYFQQGAYGLLDANIGYDSPTWSVALFARNLTNVRAVDIANGYPFKVSFGGKPRTFGASLSRKF